MRKVLLSVMAITLMTLTSCTEVESGNKGVVYKPYGGGVQTDVVFPEGVDIGISWIWNDMIEYNARQQTTNIETVLLDKNGLDVPISASVFHRVIPNKIGFLHLEKGRDYEDTYIKPVFEGVLKDVVGKYSALELVVEKRQQAQTEIQDLMIQELLINHLQAENVIIRDIDLPTKISDAIEAKQTQEQKNLLAEKKEQEQVFLANARVATAEGNASARIAESEGNFKAARFEAKARELLSTPAMIRLQQVENERIKWEAFQKTGKSPYGTNNIFGVNTPILKTVQ